jgi:phage-related protein
VVKTLEEALVKMIEVEETVKEKIIGVLEAAFKPFVEAINGLVGPMIGQIMPKLIEPVTGIFTAEKRSAHLKAIEEGFAKEDESKMDEIQKEVAGIRKEIQNKINEEIQKALEPIVGDFKTKITLDALGTIFKPLERFDKLLYWLFEFIDPGNQFYVVKALLQWKKKIKESPPEKVEELLDDEEWDIDYWKIWRSNVDLKYAGWRTAYELYYALPDSSCYPIIYVFYDFVYDIARLNKKCFKKKFSYKWGDYLSHKAKNDPSAKENWGKTVDDCFMIGYERAMKCFWKEFPPMFVDYVKRVLRVLIVDKVQNKILETTKEALEPLAQLIVPPIDNLLDFMAMVEEIITTTMDNVLSDIVGGLHPFMKTIIDDKRSFIDEVKKAAKDVLSVPSSAPTPTEQKQEA